MSPTLQVPSGLYNVLTLAFLLSQWAFMYILSFNLYLVHYFRAALYVVAIDNVIILASGLSELGLINGPHGPSAPHSTITSIIHDLQLISFINILLSYKILVMYT